MTWIKSIEKIFVSGSSHNWEVISFIEFMQLWKKINSILNLIIDYVFSIFQVVLVLGLTCAHVNSEAFFIPKFFLSASPSSAASTATRPRHVNSRLKVSGGGGSHPNYRQVKSYNGGAGRRPNYPVKAPQKPGSAYNRKPVRAPPLRQTYHAAARPVQVKH